jgi:SAM-dependent methyltransferase
MGNHALERFGPRVEDYRRYRPGYPQAFFDDLFESGSSAPAAGAQAVADIGAGTGLFTAGLLGRCRTVYAVEPNDSMRAAAVEAHSGHPSFIPVKGTAEASTLSDHCADAVFSAQAFHWFHISEAAREFRRISRPGAPTILVWNRRVDEEGFGRDYEALLTASCLDYPRAAHKRLSDEDFAGFFESYEIRRYPNSQRLSSEAFIGRAFSSSYTPPPGSPEGEFFREQLYDLFQRYRSPAGEIELAYACEAYIGYLS